jgi:L-threonylcarbamoyladenylate synthase
MYVVPFSTEALDEAIEVIRSGGVVAHATETCYGLACDLSNPVAVEHLFDIKQRPHTQHISGLFASAEEAKKYVVWNDKAEELAQKYLPGPLTIILPLQPGAGLYPVIESATTLGVRISSHPHAMQLAELAGIPLSTSSANIHGKPNPYSTEEIIEQFKDSEVQPDLVLDSGILPPTPPSTIVDCTSADAQEKRSGDLRI